jgi:subtilisin family serine protease
MLTPASTNLPRPSSLPDDYQAVETNVLDMLGLASLMEMTCGSPHVAIGLIDGPVALDHPDLASENIREIPGKISGRCVLYQSSACLHGTFVAGILLAKRQSSAPAICPGCTLLVRPIFAETMSPDELTPSATPEELAAAIIECSNAGARLINVSAALAHPPSVKAERTLADAFDYASQRGIIVVAAAGNQGAIGSTAITRHPAVIPVIACDQRGRPLDLSNLGNSIGRRGLRAPGEGIISLSTNGNRALPSGGTSVAAPFVTGALALVWSNFLNASASQLRLAIAQSHRLHRPTVVPPLLNAWAIHTAMTTL